MFELQGNPMQVRSLTHLRNIWLTTSTASIVALGFFLGSPLFAQLEPESSIETTMTVDLLDQVAVSSSVDGSIQKISTRSGQPVKQGDLLIQLDTNRLEKQLLVAEAEYQALATKSQNDSLYRIALSRERAARVNVDRLREVVARGFKVPQLEMTRAESELQQAVAEKSGATGELSQFHSEAEAKLKEIDLLQFDLQESSIQCKYDGAIAQVQKHVGEYIQKGETIAELYRLDRLAGAVLIRRDQLAPEDAIGVAGKFVIEGADGKREFDITIQRIFPRVDVDGKYRAFVDLENEQNDDGKWRLLPGLVGTAVFDVSDNRRAQDQTDRTDQSARRPEANPSS